LALLLLPWIALLLKSYNGFIVVKDGPCSLSWDYSPSLILLWLSDVAGKLLQESRQEETKLNCSLPLLLFFSSFSEDRSKCSENNPKAKTL
jgi:hypothetical protein